MRYFLSQNQHIYRSKLFYSYIPNKPYYLQLLKPVSQIQRDTVLCSIEITESYMSVA